MTWYWQWRWTKCSFDLDVGSLKGKSAKCTPLTFPFPRHCILTPEMERSEKRLLCRTFMRNCHWVSLLLHQTKLHRVLTKHLLWITTGCHCCSTKESINETFIKSNHWVSLLPHKRSVYQKSPQGVVVISCLEGNWNSQHCEKRNQPGRLVQG